MQRNKKTFKGQNIFIGIDVHKKNWQVSVITESGFTENLSILSSAKALFEFLKRHYPEGTYRAVYESGFSGFATYYALTDLGIDCIVVHAADIPSTQYESAMKSDRIDAVRLAKALRAGLLRSQPERPGQSPFERKKLPPGLAIFHSLLSFATANIVTLWEIVRLDRNKINVSFVFRVSSKISNFAV